jgi:UDP-N-acetyl-D-glucosamine dehydrogenase
VIALLREKGALVTFHDPHVPELALEAGTLKGSDLDDDLVERQDLVLILTDHAAVDTAGLVARARRVFDTRNATREAGRGHPHVRRL